MSKNSFKKSIQEKYKGRGNTWVKISQTSQAYPQFLNLIPDNAEGQTFKSHIEREGFGWLRFSKVEGTEENPLETFEVRYKGSKIDHPDNLLTVPHNVSKEFELLGNTPVKLDLEVLPENRKSKPLKGGAAMKRTSSKVKNEEEVIDVYNVEEEIKIIKEAALTKPSNQELEDWYEFLKLNDLYEENV